jgi:2,3-bisphosphoglycerate-independent phosphoglycerate mutase
VVGRYYAMDRDKRWDRTKAAYDAIILGEGESFEHPIEFIEKSYLDGITDEFVKPGISVNYHGFENGDSVFCTNFRADRMRQICSAIADSEFKEFPIKKLQLANKLMMTSYSKQLENFYEVVYPNSYPKNTLGEVIASKDLKQARIAETEKYAHVTYFFNGGIEVPFEGEERIMVPSPKVATYDLAPQMSASEVTQKVCDEISRRDFICVNFANCDMVGHTGDINATIKAVETVDYSLGRIIEACKEQNVDLLVTADHGNAEDMLDEEKGQPITSHTLNTVPLIYFGSKKCALGDGNLSDVAPTILDFMDIEIPNEMTGKSLWKKD